MPNPTILAELPKYTREAVRFYWLTRSQQLEKQRQAGGSDQGLRSAVTGGAQMNGFIELLTKLVIETGIDRAHIFYEQSLELPGYFRPDKKWDFIVVVNGQLVAALEAKSQVGPSFAEDFESLAYEPIGRALDLWAAFRKAEYAVRPWVGHLFLLENPDSAHVQRCEALCQRLFLERYYDSVALLASADPRGEHNEPARSFGFDRLATSLVAHITAFSRRIEQLHAA